MSQRVSYYEIAPDGMKIMMDKVTICFWQMVLIR